MRVTRWFFIIIAIYLLGFFGHALYLQKTVYGDGIFYYSWLHSAVVDRDIDFQNEYAFYHINQPITSTGLVANKYSVGPSLLWFPLFSVTHLLMRGNGYGLPYQIAVGLSSVLYCLTGLILLYRLLSKFFRPNISLLTILSIAFAINLFFYGSLDTVNSHGLSFFAATLFLTFLFEKKQNWLLVGSSLGLVSLIRPQDLVFALLIIPFLSFSTLTSFVVGLLVAFFPQLLAWQALYGNFWTSPYLTGGEAFNFLHSHILEVLFSPQNGLFLYSPILFLGLIGLFFWKNRLKIFFTLALLLELLVVASWSTWWQGASYGGRMFVSSLPLFAFGIANVFSWLTRRGWNEKLLFFILIGPLSAINIVLILLFLVNH